ncbi:MAG: MMPL family transporter [Deltaproteobacteria bacterium]|nr:MMPL family transporter [Deltaproteobacteria bacterium]
MSKFKRKIEEYFEQLGHLLFRNRFKTLFLVFLFIGVLVYNIPDIIIDTSSEAMLHEDDPSRIEYNAFRDQFGGANMIIVGVKAPNIFCNDFLKKLKALHHELEKELPYVQEVNSLINARNTRGENDVLYVDDLLKDWPENDVDMALLKKQVLNNPVYLNNIISKDGNLTAIVIETAAFVEEDTDSSQDLSGFEDGFEDDFSGDTNAPVKRRYFSQKQNMKLVDSLNRIVKRHETKSFSMAVTGGPVVVDVFNRYTASDMKLLFLMATGIIIFFITILFQRISGVVLPFIIVYSSMASTLGLMAIFNAYITLMSVVLPTFLVAVGIADSVHILSIFYRRFQQGSSKEDAISYAMGHSGLAIVMTSITTAAGLLSFSFSELSAIGNLGIFAAAGVILALVYTIIMLPALIAAIPIKFKETVKDEKRSAIMDRFLLFFTNLSTTHPKKILLICPFLFVLSIFFICRLELTHSMMRYFPDSFAVKQDALFIDKELRGMLTIEVVVDTKKENGIYEPLILNSIDKISKHLESIKQSDIFVGKVFSITDILKETNQALHGNDSNHYTIPQDREIIAQEFLLFENSGSDDLEQIVDSKFSKTRITIKIPWVDLVIIDRFVKEVREIFRNEFPAKIDVTITGLTPIMGRTITEAMHSMTKSYIIAFIVISILMIILVGNFKIGLLSMIPNLLPIFTVIGIMGIAKVPMDLTALMIGSIAIGLVVDDTMHFMYNFRKYYNINENVYEAVKETLLGTGRALLLTSIILSSNFFILMVATLRNSLIFGFYTGLVIIFALLADFLIAPAIMTVITHQRER